MLEGTKHEKAVIVVLAYIIGLTSGFIGFGVNNHYQEKALYASSVDMSATLETVPEFTEPPVLGTTDRAGYVPPTENPPGVSDSSETLQYIDGQLTVLTEEGAMVLSVHVDALGDTIPDILATQGHHTEPPVFLESPTGDFVYFCEQHLGEDDCTHLLFDKSAASIQYLQVENQKLTTPSNQAAAAYWAADGLHLGEYVSESLATPWQLVRKAQ